MISERIFSQSSYQENVIFGRYKWINNMFGWFCTRGYSVQNILLWHESFVQKKPNKEEYFCAHHPRFLWRNLSLSRQKHLLPLHRDINTINYWHKWQLSQDFILITWIVIFQSMWPISPGENPSLRILSPSECNYFFLSNISHH